MNQPPDRLGSFDNRGSGTQNTKLGDGSQNNNNSSGGQYNISAKTVHFASNYKDEQNQNQARIDDDIIRSLAFPQMWDRRDHIEPCYRNTCQWILGLDEYRSWREQSHGLLWIKGKPGAGKSTLMAFLHEELRKSPDESQGLRLEFFFTARGTELQRTPVGMLRSLLIQILKSNVTVCSELRKAYLERCREFGKGNWEWPQGPLEKLFQYIILKLATQQQVTIFVDALDEAGADTARRLADYFHKLNHDAAENAAKVKICISCRHYPIVGKSTAREITVEAHNDKDITTYIEHYLDDMVATDGPHQEGWKDLMKALIKQAEGVFQWAHIVMPLIKRDIDEGRSPRDIRCWLPTVPGDLEDVYQYILEHVIRSKYRTQAFQFFQWVTLAERPLTVTEMRYAMAANKIEATRSSVQWQEINNFIETDESMRRLTKTLSGGLAEVAKSHENGEIVQVVHQSVNEFSRAKGLAYLSSVIETVTPLVKNETIILQCQAMLYRSCLFYIATAETLWESLQDRRDMGKDVLTKNEPFLNYATVNLLVHAKKAANFRSFELGKEIKTLKKMVGRWVKFYQLFDRHKAACPPDGTTILHMAAAANMADIAASLASDNENITVVDVNGNTPFHSAARCGHIEVGKILLEKGAKLNTTSGDDETALIKAASRGHMGFVEWLLHEGAAIDTMTGSSGGALQAASSEGKGDIVRILLGAGADVNAQGGEYGNALQAASLEGKGDIVRILLGAGADVNAPGSRFGNVLQAASLRGSAEVVKILLDAKADVNALGGEYGNALQAASWRGSAEVVKMLLDTKADVNAQGGRFGNALQAASYEGSAEVVKMLLDAKADINTQGGEYGNALQAASYKGNAEVVKMLLNAKADVNAQGGEYGNALQAASLEGKGDIVRILLGAGADVNAPGSRFGNALQAASLRGNAEVVKMLLDAKADVNALGGEYGNALQSASYDGSAEVVKMLLNAKADVNALGGKYGNALQAALWRGSAEVVKMLLDAKADVNAQGGEYGNALQAASYDGSAEVVKILLNAKADVNALGGKYGNTLQAASWRGSAEVVKMLLDAKADVNAQGGEYGNALQAASWRGSAEVVKMLLDAKADVNALGGKYGNALQAASWRGSAEVVKMLLDAKADVNTPRGEYGNALQAASWRGSAEVVKMLLDAKADVNAQGGRFGNALQAASYKGSAEVVKMLLDGKADVNAQGGEYGNALLAAVHAAFFFQINILLQAGADPSLFDSLHRSPIHIAASKSLLPLLRQFPVFSFAINAQDIFLRTPLHLAVLNGHLHFALALLELGADPLLQDGYGRNILDWAADFPRLVAQLHHLPSSVMPTDYQKQRATVRQSIHQISNTLLCCIPDPARPLLPLLQQLGHYLLFLDDTDNARSILSFNFNNEDLEVGAKKNLNCDICDESIHGMRVVCRVCVTLNFCLSCTRRYPTHRRWNSHKVHEIFEVPYEPPSDFYPTMEHFSALLQRLARQFGGIPELDNKSMIVDSLPPKTRPDLPMPRGPHSLTTYLLFGLLVTSLCTWHFFHRK